MKGDKHNVSTVIVGSYHNNLYKSIDVCKNIHDLKVKLNTSRYEERITFEQC